MEEIKRLITRNQKRSDNILSFLKSNDLITVARLERKCKIPPTTLSRALKVKKIPKEYLSVIEDELVKHVFKKIK